MFLIMGMIIIPINRKIYSAIFVIIFPIDLLIFFSVEKLFFIYKILGKINFSTQKTLKFHMKHKHAENRLVYPCPDCTDTFSNSWSVFRHLFKVHRLVLYFNLLNVNSITLFL